MTSSLHILVVEDDELVQTLVAALLSEKGFKVSSVGTGAEMAAILEVEKIDLVVLDLGLPDEDGLVMTRQVRARSNIPIVVMTAREEQDDRIAALEIGADDYLVKPFDPRELILRIENLLARSGAADGVAHEKLGSNKIEVGTYTLNTDARTLHSPDGDEIAMTPAEYNVLLALAKAPNRVLSRGHLVDAISRGADTPGDRVIDVVISRLRKKLGDPPRKPELIHTVAGFGYRLSVK